MSASRMNPKNAATTEMFGPYPILRTTYGTDARPVDGARTLGGRVRLRDRALRLDRDGERVAVVAALPPHRDVGGRPGRGGERVEQRAAERAEKPRVVPRIGALGHERP